MTYNPDIPQPTDNPSQSQPLILDNFQELNDQYGISGDHVEWTASSGNGKHKRVTWIDQTASPPTAGVNEVVAYSLTQSGITNPYYKRDNSATFYPLSPIKAYASLNATAANTVAILESFNINTATLATGAGNTFSINLINAMKTATNYGIIVTVAFPFANTFNTYYTAVDASNFNVVTFAPSFPFKLTILAIEI